MVSMCEQKIKSKVETYGLQPADILLVHTRRSLWGWLIRFGTHCYWNHALMVCSLGERNHDCYDALVVDAKTDGSIVLSNLSEYLERSDKYDVAVKRFRTDWFNNGGQSPVFNVRDRICRIAMNEAQFTLDKRLMIIMNRIIRQSTVIWRFIRRKIRKAYKQPQFPWSTRPTQIKAFTCGGFVQWCYYMGFLKTIGGKGKNQYYLKDVIFNPRIEEKPTPFGLLTTTPADLAYCDKLSWEFVIKNGVVQQVSNNEDVMLAIASPESGVEQDTVVLGKNDSQIGETAADFVRTKELSLCEHSRYRLPRLFRLARQLAVHSKGCEICRGLEVQIAQFDADLSDQPLMSRQILDEYLSMMKNITRHLKLSHGLVEERHYVRRFVFTGFSFGISVVILGLILLNFGITLLALNITLVALITRVTFGYIIGYFMDRRARKQGRVI